MALVLWAEDNPIDRMFIHAALDEETSRPAIEFVDDGDALLQRLESSAPSLIVLDLHMPKASGLEVLSLLHQRAQSAPVIIFSCAEGAATIAACYRLGAAKFIQKPQDFREFKDCVKAVLQEANAAPHASQVEAPRLSVKPQADALDSHAMSIRQ
jgi:DNA-binding NarL/FixJ family response regulator